MCKIKQTNFLVTLKAICLVKVVCLVTGFVDGTDAKIELNSHCLPFIAEFRYLVCTFNLLWFSSHLTAKEYFTCMDQSMISISMVKDASLIIINRTHKKYTGIGPTYIYITFQKIAWIRWLATWNIHIGLHVYCGKSHTS